MPHGCRVSFGGDESLMEPDMVMVHSIVNVVNATKLYS